MIQMHHFAIRVENLERSLAFYCDVLGFVLVEMYSWHEGQNMIDKIAGREGTAGRAAFISTGNAFLELFEYENMGHTEALRWPAHICVSTSELASLHARVQNEAKSTAAEIVNSGLGTSLAWVTDPDGNLIELLQIHDSKDRLALPH